MVLKFNRRKVVFLKIFLYLIVKKREIIKKGVYYE